ncbi:hypothetical protein BH10ACI3_BH10ACI3_16670 [soil metagenome]
MATVDVKKIRERVTKINDAWETLARSASFGVFDQTAFQTDITAAATAEHSLADLLAQVDAKRDEIADL